MSLISYASFPVKALSVPCGEKEAAEAGDFLRFRTDEEPEGRTRIRICRSRTELFLDAFCDEPAEIHDQNKTDDWSIFAGGDRLEVFFGSFEPEPRLLQFAIGAGGGRSDSTGHPELWRAEVRKNGGHAWQVRMAFPISLLPMSNLSVRFNICRFSEARDELSSWCRLYGKFHEIESFGFLAMAGFEHALFAETGVFPEGKLSREEFEEAIRGRMIPAHTIRCGPWATHPSPTEMTVSFLSEGFCGAFLEYRKESGPAEWTRLPFDCRDGILIRNRTIHHLRLRDLTPGSRYLYRIITLHPLTNEELTGQEYAFTTLDPAKGSFSFTAVSDLHSDAETLNRLLALKETGESDFLVSLGDYLSCSCGSESYRAGFLDAESRWSRQNGKPLVFTRGNHEQIGLFAGLYQDIFPRPDGKTYYAFRHGNVFFLALDAGNDKPDDEEGLFRNADMLAEEQAWLRQVLRSEECLSATWKIALVHTPAWDSSRYDSGAAFSLLSLIPDPDLVLAGHVHRYFTIKPGSGIRCFKREGKTDPAPDAPDALTVANATNTMIHVRAEGRSALDITVLDRAGVLVDHLRVTKQEAGGTVQMQ